MEIHIISESSENMKKQKSKEGNVKKRKENVKITQKVKR
jgi:hypothetical protein